MFLKMPFPFSTIKISCYEINHPFIFQQAKLILKIFPVKRKTVKRNKTFREIPDGWKKEINKEGIIIDK